MVEDEEISKVKSYKDFEKIVNKLQEDVRSLKTRLGKLNSRAELFDLLAFQKQLDSLNDRIKEWSDNLTASNRNVAMNAVSLTYLKAQQLIDNKHSYILAQMIADLGKINERIRTSDNPLEVAEKYGDDIAKQLESAGIKGAHFVL
jgi:primosomal protein N''